LIPPPDDGIVVDMETVDTITYLDGLETMRRRELEYGVVRDTPSPTFAHQSVVTSLVSLLASWVRACGLGRICVSPIDVVLDAPQALIVQPDAVFIATSRLGIINNQIWGAPDLVIEVLSPGTIRRDRTKKLRWYRRYGIGECWLADSKTRTIEVVTFEGRVGRRASRRHFTGRRAVESGVLGVTPVCAADVFEY
jgi:Uma2 family endonuclease